MYGEGIPFKNCTLALCYQVGYLDLDMKNLDETEKKSC